jgi:hypothetical protein
LAATAGGIAEKREEGKTERRFALDTATGEGVFDVMLEVTLTDKGSEDLNPSVIIRLADN